MIPNSKKVSKLNHQSMKST